jgi:hypothetical protein
VFFLVGSCVLLTTVCKCDSGGWQESLGGVGFGDI